MRRMALWRFSLPPDVVARYQACESTQQQHELAEQLGLAPRQLQNLVAHLLLEESNPSS